MGGWKRDLGGFRPFGNQVFSHAAFTERCVYIQGLLHREGASQRDGFTQRDDFTQGCFYLQIFLHRDTFNTEMPLHTGALRYKHFYTEMILLRETFRHRRVFTRVPLHLYTQMFLHMCFYMLTGLQYTLLYEHFFLRWDSFTRKHFYAEALWHSGRHVYMQILLHGGVHFACVFFT